LIFDFILNIKVCTKCLYCFFKVFISRLLKNKIKISYVGLLKRVCVVRIEYLERKMDKIPLKVEFDGRQRSLERDVKQLNTMTKVHESSTESKMSTMIKIQMTSNAIRYAYLILLTLFLILYAVERVPEHYQDNDWGSVAIFVIGGTIMYAIPYFLLDVILYIGRLF